jgi:hypothetical protein
MAGLSENVIRKDVSVGLQVLARYNRARVPDPAA